MESVEVVVIGGGQAGLATSRLLVEAGKEHVVLESDRVGGRWTTQSWDSQRLITPNWMSRLPGWSYRGPDPDGYMRARDVARFLEEYAWSFAAPVLEGVTVQRVFRCSDGFAIRTDQAAFRSPNVIIATGSTGEPAIPRAVSDAMPLAMVQMALRDYRNPGLLPDGGVLIVGSSASGLSVADELSRAGRDVVLAVGRHAWLPRRIDGRDAWWWLDRAGWLRQTIHDVHDVDAARSEPRLQLLGSTDEVDLTALNRRGVRLVGRVQGAQGGRLHVADDLGPTLIQGRRATHRLLHRLTLAGADLSEVQLRPLPDVLPVTTVDLARDGVTSVLWATGYRPAYPWLDLPVVSGSGHVRQYRGATAVPGLWIVGTRFQHRRDSTFLDGVRHDAKLVVDQLVAERSVARKAS